MPPTFTDPPSDRSGPDAGPAHPFRSTGLPDEPADDARCSCCGGTSGVFPVVRGRLAVCRACVRSAAADGRTDVLRFLADEDPAPVPCPHCGWHRTCRDAGDLAGHLLTFHRLADDHAAAVVVHAIECRTIAAATA